MPILSSAPEVSGWRTSGDVARAAVRQGGPEQAHPGRGAAYGRLADQDRLGTQEQLDKQFHTATN